MTSPFSANYVAEAQNRNIKVNYYVEISGFTTVLSKQTVSGKTTKNRISKSSWNPQKVRIDTAKTTTGTTT